MDQPINYRRLIERRLKESLLDTPVVLLVGPRRCGKTTLVRKMDPSRKYITLDDSSTLEFAVSDPTGFVRGLENATIDEVQRSPKLLLAIKRSVDEDKRPGRFLLTGSSNVFALPQVEDSLAGRIETLQMLPLAQSEILSSNASFLQNMFDKSPKCNSLVVADDLVNLVLNGGFPEALERKEERRRIDWFRSYLNSVVAQDLRDFGNIGNKREISMLVEVIAEHSGQLANYSQFGNSIKMNYKTTQKYIHLLEQVFVITVILPWFSNKIKRLSKTARVHFLDSGILASVKKLTFDRIKSDRNEFGPLLESFVVSEILKLASGSDLRLSLYHFREQDRHEVDIVIERDDGMLVGIEVKASASVRMNDFSGLKLLAESCKERFAFGAVLYDGTDVHTVGEQFAAVPISALWY